MVTELYANSLYMGREFSPFDMSDEPQLVWGYFCNGSPPQDCGFFIPITDIEGPGIESAEWHEYETQHFHFHMSRVKSIQLIIKEDK